MNNREIIKDILIEEISKCNNFNYQIKINNLKLVVNTKKFYQSLIDNSYSFEGGIDSKRLFKKYEKYESKIFHLSYEDIWSKFEDKTKLNHYEIQSIVKEVLEETFKIKNVIPDWTIGSIRKQLEEGFKINGIIPLTSTLPTFVYLNNG